MDIPDGFLDLVMKFVKVSASADVTRPPGSLDLDAFPLLVHAPAQYGPGVRTENNGTPVSEIAAAFVETPDAALVAAIFGATASHVEQAVRYATLSSSGD